ncbi:regulatory signaling modulator protein AmpE [Pseudidiomarina sp.]|uniref:regulatory signaling modulator protein AmpE n=1 Tax=Pseudidiomarina sp. TaxID=2081707 RepID=UPI003A97AD2A
MYLLVILLAYSLERTLEITRNLHWRRIILRWQHWQVRGAQLEAWRQHDLGQVLWAIIPALFIGFVLALLNNVLLTFLVSAAGLLAAIQAPAARAAYKRYLQAESEEDGAEQARQLKLLQQASGRKEAAPVEHLLLWIHLRHYFAVMIYFVLLGVTGALVYATLRDMRHNKSPRWQTVHQIINWLPTRLMTLGFLLVGNFSKALPVWLSSIGNKPQNNFIALTKVAELADDLTAPTTTALVKRNFLLYVVFVALLTIGGWV